MMIFVFNILDESIKMWILSTMDHVINEALAFSRRIADKKGSLILLFVVCC